MDSTQQTKTFEILAQYTSHFEREFLQIPDERRNQLRQLSNYIFSKQQANLPIRLVVICTHNSRRSHIGQLWLAAAAAHYGIENVHTYSGGTEATAFNPRAVRAMRQAGFEIVTAHETENPVYFAAFDYSPKAIKLFSKKYDHAENPTEDFAAIMVCTDADEACPIIVGAEKRFALPYEDPKSSDDSPMEKIMYNERVRQIGIEMFYVMNVVSKLM